MAREICSQCNGTGLCEGCRRHGRQACRENTGYPCCPNCKRERKPGWIDR